MGFNRRTFLQKAGLGLAALGVSETLLSLLVDRSLAVPVLDRYFQALAQPNGRKLALLVGINQYPRSTALAGCVTDVELQRELLMHRFGFKATDILTLIDSQATRENIEMAFVEHLTKQAGAGDVVVFHFSGYGSRVKMSAEGKADNAVRLQNSFVPVDGILPTKGALAANDVLEETLVLLLLSLATDYVTTILDTSHTDEVNILQGNLRVRSAPHPPAERPSPEELVFQEQLLQRVTALRVQLKQFGSLNLMPGLVLTAAGPSQSATEAQWSGFSAGLFTYTLTQYLWQVAPAATVQISLSRTAGTVKQLVGKDQQPKLMGQKSLNPLLAYYLPPDGSIGADGVVTALEDSNTAQLWLAGLPATVLEYYGTNSLLELVDGLGLGLPTSEETKQPTPEPEDSAAVELAPPSLKSIQLQMRSKEGLTAKARIVSNTDTQTYPLQVGQLVQELVRVLPHNLGLTVALDARLERIERVDATSAFANISSVSSVVVAGEQPADYLFGKGQPITTPEGLKQQFQGGYGLFYLARDPIRNTMGEEGEAVKSAVNRLSPKFKTLLAAKWLRLTANEGSSRLGIRAVVQMVAPEQKDIALRETWRAASSFQGTAAKDAIAPRETAALPTLPIGSHIQYKLENYSTQPIYFMLLGFDAGGNAIALYQNKSPQPAPESAQNPSLTNRVIPPGETLIVPHPTTALDWLVSGPAGLAEIQLIFSRCPFTEADTALESSKPAKGEGERIGDLLNPLEVARAVLQDLHQASAVAPDAIGTISDSYALDLNAWATLSFVYQVV
ncbi:MAG TPA: peptidase C14 [Cyanobacteria bacterium UBA8803]|nr:peptidase C14 [Cyanobacteria bacterium UBA9273]HBL61285.1 peptidase C14 [Cyanobacteria bacterium UBA8803]